MQLQYFDRGIASDREQLVCAIVHTSDLVGQALPLHLAKGWGAAVLAEFSEQSRMEKQLRLPLTPFMVDLHIPKRQADLQAGFVANIVLPLWQAMAVMFPGLSGCVRECEANHAFYTAQKEEAAQKEKAEKEEAEMEAKRKEGMRLK